MDDTEYYRNVPYPGGRIVDRVPVNGAEQTWPSNAIRCVTQRWLGPVYIRTQGVEFTVRYVGVHEHTKRGVYPLHTHPHSEMLFTLDGGGLINLPKLNKVERCVPGHLLVLPPGSVHQSQWNTRGGSLSWRILVVNFDIVIDMSQVPVESGEMVDMAFSPFYDWFYLQRGEGINIRGAEREPIFSILKDVADTIAHQQYGICSDVVTSLMRAISLMSRHMRRVGIADGTQLSPTIISKESALLKARSLIEHGGYRDAGCMANIAQSVGMSESHFVREFKRTYGTTPKQYSINIIMRRAAALLNEKNISVKNASHYLGFNNPSSFTRAFTQFHGVSPTEYQSRRRAESD